MRGGDGGDSGLCDILWFIFRGGGGGGGGNLQDVESETDFVMLRDTTRAAGEQQTDDIREALCVRDQRGAAARTGIEGRCWYFFFFQPPGP